MRRSSPRRRGNDQEIHQTPIFRDTPVTMIEAGLTSGPIIDGADTERDLTPRPPPRLQLTPRRYQIV